MSATVSTPEEPAPEQGSAAAAAGVVLRPEDFGARPGKDCTTAFRTLMDTLETKRLKADGGGGVPVCRAAVLLGEGPYLVSGPIMRPRAGRAQALTVQGLGKRASEIVLTGEGPLLVNQDRWMNVRWRDCSFRSADPKGAYLYSYSTGAAQDWVWENCEWRGRWAYGIGLDGPEKSNTNSEFGFVNCHVNGAYDKAFLWSGMSPQHAQQDQFLNFWFRDMKVEYDWGDFLRFDKGGFISCTGGSYIVKGHRPDGGTSRFFHLPTAGHHDAVQHLAVRDVRFELRHATTQVIRSRWKGHVLFEGCSDTAWGFKEHSASLVAHEYHDPGVVAYRDCDLVGRHAYHLTERPSRQVASYTSCTRKNHRTAAAFLVREGPHAARLRVVHRDDGDGIR
ncbi:hypothetical protein GCM10027168_31870 [Streptomyces capparidis]